MGAVLVYVPSSSFFFEIFKVKVICTLFMLATLLTLCELVMISPDKDNKIETETLRRRRWCILKPFMTSPVDAGVVVFPVGVCERIKAESFKERKKEKSDRNMKERREPEQNDGRNKTVS